VRSNLGPLTSLILRVYVVLEATLGVSLVCSAYGGSCLNCMELLMGLLGEGTEILGRLGKLRKGGSCLIEA
jgi:hypothetical protein